MENARVHLRIEGRVQGVFMRHHTQETALRLGLTGWVKNLMDGSVEAVIEGEKNRLEKMIRWCRQGPPTARVTKVDTLWEEYTGEFEDFSILH
jgi:acylphosphatase